MNLAFFVARRKKGLLIKMEQLASWISTVSDFVWNNLLLWLLVGTGILFTIRTRFVQLRKLGEGFRNLFSGFSLKGKKAGKEGMSSFQALTTAIAAQVGTGNITGCATALYSGGPIYYIRARFTGRFGKFLAGFFALAIIFALGFTGNMVQANSISAAFTTAFHIPPIVTGILVAVMAGFIFIGGVARIASITEKLVPVMSVFYVLGCLIILCINHDMILSAFQSIFAAAFNPQAVLGGAVGITVREAMRFGVARGLFSNEAGMGSTPHAHALAKVEKPQDQGIIAMVGVFFDTFIVLTLTALVILTSGLLQPGVKGALEGTALAQAAFNHAFGGFGNVFVAICMFFFAFSTIIGWYFFGERNVKALFGKKAIKIYAAIVVVCIAVGSALKVNLVWNLSDLFNGLMVFPNLIALLFLSSIVKKAAKGEDILKK